MNIAISLLVIPIFLVFAAAVGVGLFFLIRYFIRYNATVKEQAEQQQKQKEEIDKMNIEDL